MDEKDKQQIQQWFRFYLEVNEQEVDSAKRDLLLYIQDHFDDCYYDNVCKNIDSLI